MGEGSPLDALRELADRTAVQLVAQALERIVTGQGAITVAFTESASAGVQRIDGHTMPKRRALPAAPPAKRKPGRPRKSATPALDRLHEKHGVDHASIAKAAGDPGATRRCRQCKKLGTAEHVPGDDRTLRCNACGHRWTMRLQGHEKTAVAASQKPRRANAKAEPGACTRCDHEQSAHIGSNGKCLVPKCVCPEFYE